MMSQSTVDVEMNPQENGGPANFGSNGSSDSPLSMRLLGWMDDHLNPIVVKELRQAVRSRFITILINILLFVELAIVTMFLLSSDDRSFSMGRDVFTALHFLLLISSVFFVPAYVGIRFAAERSAQNVDLMFTTTISPLSIIWGKFLSGVIITALLFSTAGPFMVLTYMLRGIDVPTILLIVVIDFLAVIAAVQFAILLMSGSVSVAARGGMLVLCMILFPYLIGAVGIATAGVTYGFGGSWWRNDEFWLYATYFLLLNLAYHVGLMLASAAVVSPPTSNRAVGIRSFLVAIWLVSGTICLVTSLVRNESDWILGWCITSVGITCLVLLVTICERDRWGLRVLVTIPANPIKRMLAFLFYSGSAGGVLLCLLIIGGSLVLTFFTYTKHADEVMTMLTFCLYITAYCLTAVFVVRYLTGGYIKTEGTAAFALLFLAIGCMGPVLVAYFIDPRGNWDNGIMWRIGNPFAGEMGSGSDKELFLWISAIWAGGMMLLCLPWMAGQVKAFRKPPAAAATDQDALEHVLEVHDQAPPLLDDPQVKADL